jgi:hypothetical protein
MTRSRALVSCLRKVCGRKPILRKPLLLLNRQLSDFCFRDTQTFLLKLSVNVRQAASRVGRIHKIMLFAGAVCGPSDRAAHLHLFGDCTHCGES